MHKYFKYIIILLLLLCKAHYAQLTPLPPGLQAIMFKKIFSYTKTVENSERAKIVVVYDASTEKQRDAIVRAFQKENLQVRTSTLDALTINLKGNSIVYVVPGMNNGTVKNICRINKVLSISGNPAFAEKGEVSISVAQEKGRPRIIINLEQLRFENQDVSSELINLAKIVH